MAKLLFKMSLLLPVLLAVFAVNWLVDPANIKNDVSYEKGVAQILMSGKNVANLVNYKERALQKLVIQGLKQAPEVVVLGSSRSMPIGSAFFPGRSLLNHSVSGASIEDYLGIYDLYRVRGLKPGLVVLGLDPWVLNRANDQDRWRDLYAEQLEMKSVLGVQAGFREQLIDRLRNGKKYTEFLSPAYLNQAVLYLVEKGADGKKYWATGAAEADVPVKLADGSYIYGKKTRERSQAEIDNDARAFSLAKPMYSLGGYDRLDPATMGLLEGLVRFMRADGVQVHFFLPPYHPTVYRAIATRGEYAMVAQAEKWYRSLAQRHGVTVLGSFDPAPAGLTAADFDDGMHPKQAAVARVFSGNVPTEREPAPAQLQAGMN